MKTKNNRNFNIRVSNEKIIDKELHNTFSNINFNSTIKDEIIFNFNNSEFELTEEIDEDIKSFIFNLNKSPFIKTNNSCQGHNESDSPYISFQVNEIGWNLFWLDVAPNLSMMPGIRISTIPWVNNDLLNSICIYINNGDVYKNLKWSWIKKCFMSVFNGYTERDINTKNIGT